MKRAAMYLGGGLLAGIGKGVVADAQAKREQVLAELREQRADRRAQDDRDFRREEAEATRKEQRRLLHGTVTDENRGVHGITRGGEAIDLGITAADTTSGGAVRDREVRLRMLRTAGFSDQEANAIAGGASVSPNTVAQIYNQMLTRQFLDPDEADERMDAMFGPNWRNVLRGQQGQEPASPQDQSPAYTPLPGGGVSIDLRNRPPVQNRDGSVSTERSITVTDPRLNDGRPTNIPSMFGGREVSQDEAIERIVRAGGKDPETGRSLPAFDSIEEAVAAAKARSERLGQGGQPGNAPQGAGTRENPYRATTQDHINWFRDHANPGDVVEVSGKLFTK